MDVVTACVVENLKTFEHHCIIRWSHIVKHEALKMRVDKKVKCELTKKLAEVSLTICEF